MAEPQEERKWQRALRPLSANSASSASSAQLAADKPARGAGTGDGKQKAGRHTAAATNRLGDSASGRRASLASRRTSLAGGAAGVGKENAPAPARASSVLSVGKTTGTPIRKARPSVSGRRTSSARLPTPDSLTHGAAAPAPGAAPCAFGRAAPQQRAAAGGSAEARQRRSSSVSVNAAAPPPGGRAGPRARCAHSILAAVPATTAAPASAAAEVAPPGSSQRRQSRRLSAGNPNRHLGMDKLQSEYEVLQQKLALLKRDTNRDAGRLGTGGTPMSAAPRKPGEHAPASVSGVSAMGVLPPTAAFTGAAPDSALPASRAGSVGPCGGDTGPLLHSYEGLQAHCSLPDAAGVLASLNFSDRHPGSRLADLASAAFSDPEFVSSAEQALSARLTRTKDGATTQSRINELAGVCAYALLCHTQSCLHACFADE